MFELFAMSLREYWNELDDGSSDTNSSLAELQEVLTEHYGKNVAWNDPEPDPSKRDEEISVDVIDDRQISALHAVAAKLELDGELDGLEFDPEQPWESDVFNRLEEELEDEAAERDIEKFCHLLSIGNSFECLCIPVDLPFVSQININGDDEDDACECGEHECHCHCQEHADESECECGCGDDCCCFEEDDKSIDVSSSIALRRELDLIADALHLDKSINIDEDGSNIDFDDEDPYRFAKIGWYIMSAKVNEAIASNQTLVIRFNDEDDYDFDDEDGEDGEE